MIDHPEFRNDFADQLSVTKNAHHRAFRNHNSHSFGDCTHVSGGNVTTAESERNFYFRCDAVEIATRGNDNSCLTYHKPTIELRQFLHGSSKIEIGDMSRRLWVAQ